MSNNLLRLSQMYIKEYLRDPSVLLFSVLFVIGLSVALGFAFSAPTELSYRLVVVQFPQENELENSPQQNSDSTANSLSSNLYKVLETINPTYVSFNNSENKFFIDLPNEDLGSLSFEINAATEEQAKSLYRQGKIHFYIQHSDKKLLYFFDPLKPESKSAYLAFKQLQENPKSLTDSSQVMAIEEVGLRYIDFLVPGLLAMLTMNTFIWGVGFSLVDMRTKKILRRFIVTPMRKTDFILSQFIARFVFGMLEVSLVLIIMTLIFQLPLNGGVLQLFTLYFAGSVTFWGLAVVFSARINDSKLAYLVVNLSTAVLILISGVFYDYHSFPNLIQNLIQWTPLAMLADGYRESMTLGMSMSAYLQTLIYLISLGLVSAFLGLKLFKWY